VVVKELNMGGCCSNGVTPAESKDDPCKSKPKNSNVLLIIFIVLICLAVLRIAGYYFIWSKIPEHPHNLKAYWM